MCSIRIRDINPCGHCAAALIRGGREADSQNSAFRTLNLIDLYSRECLALHVKKIITGEAMSNALDQGILLKGLPQRIKVDNSPEFISRALDTRTSSTH